jgi:hypothetical protein
MDFLLVAHINVRVPAQEIVQRRRSRFLNSRQDEIESIDFATLGSKHRHKSRTADGIAQSALLKFRKRQP